MYKDKDYLLAAASSLVFITLIMTMGPTDFLASSLHQE